MVEGHHTCRRGPFDADTAMNDLTNSPPVNRYQTIDEVSAIECQTSDGITEIYPWSSRDDTWEWENDNTYKSPGFKMSIKQGGALSGQSRSRGKRSQCLITTRIQKHDISESKAMMSSVYQSHCNNTLKTKDNSISRTLPRTLALCVILFYNCEPDIRQSPRHSLEMRQSREEG